MFHVLCIKVIIFHISFYLSRKLHLIKLIAYSRIFFLKMVRFFDLKEILHVN